MCNVPFFIYYTTTFPKFHSFLLSLKTGKVQCASSWYLASQNFCQVQYQWDFDVIFPKIISRRNQQARRKSGHGRDIYFLWIWWKKWDILQFVEIFFGQVFLVVASKNWDENNRLKKLLLFWSFTSIWCSKNWKRNWQNLVKHFSWNNQVQKIIRIENNNFLIEDI